MAIEKIRKLADNVNRKLFKTNTTFCESCGKKVRLPRKIKDHYYCSRKECIKERTIK